ncbi:MAG: prolipoprotein diacylglyceryl transferase [Alphaproteobacteria bacterium]
MNQGIPFPVMDPVLIEIGPLAIRWYALAYVAGLVLGWLLVRALVRRDPAGMTLKDVDDFLTWATLGVIAGGRIGYVLAYNLPHFLDSPLEILALWRGGMSFHGGLAGVLVALVLFARARRIDVLALADRVACATPIGLLFGRLANFVNGELYGRVTEAPWGVVFPSGGPLPRHPSQLYEAALEGLVLLIAMLALWRWTGLSRTAGRLTGVFLIGYALARLAVELVREPDAQLGLILGPITMGQLLSLPLLLGGGVLLARRSHAVRAARP